MDSPQFDGQLFQLGCTNLNKGLAGYPGVVAEFVHPVPVGGVYTQLLHQLQADAAFPSQFLAKFLPPFVLSAQFLQSSTTNFILLGRHFLQTVCPVPRVLQHDLFFEFLPIALIRQFVEQCIEPGEIGYFLCHILLSLFSPPKG